MMVSPVSWQIEKIHTTSSTQEEIRARLREGDSRSTSPPQSGLLIQAEEQTGGRGRGAHRWSSPPGNLYMSFLLCPDPDDVPPARLGELAFVCGLALYRAVKACRPGTSYDLRLKWPNDLLVSGKKLSGFLIENEPGPDGAPRLICGAGVNVHAPPQDAASLSMLSDSPAANTDSKADIDALRDAFLNIFGDLYRAWPSDFTAILDEWRAHAFGIGQKMTLRLPGETSEGIFKGLTPRGELVMTCPGGADRIVSAGDVFFGKERTTDASGD